MVGIALPAPSGGLIYVGSDTERSIGSSTTETEIGSVIIPANTVTTRIEVKVAIKVLGSGNDAFFRLKIGADGSEVLKQVVRLSGRVGDARENGGALLFYDSTQTWTNEISVIVTAQNNQPGAGDVATCLQLGVFGY